MSSTQAELLIDQLSKSGEGVGTHGGRAVFVEGALPKERVRVAIRQRGKVQSGQILEVLSSSPARRPAACPLFDRCGGCDWLHLDDAAQREAKQEILLSALEHIAKVDRGRLELLAPIVSPKQMGYRRRATLHFAGAQLCFYERRSHRSVQVARCPALVPALADLPGALSQHLAPIAREVAAVYLVAAGERSSFALELKGLIRKAQLDRCESAVRQLALAGAVLLPSSGSPRMVGSPVLQEIDGDGAPLYLRPDAFAQVNPEVNAMLARSVLEHLGPEVPGRVLELYSGNGNFTFRIASRAEQVVGVESSGAALELARRSAREAAPANVRFIQGDAAKICEALVADGARFDSLVADPPRTGARGIGLWARQFEIRKVVYVGCDPAALARDCAQLAENGLEPVRLQLVDMFPQTRHVEAVLSFAAKAG
jgi:23S rRNA (uracil1939-C5)-methyltransferase